MHDTHQHVTICRTCDSSGVTEPSDQPEGEGNPHRVKVKVLTRGLTIVLASLALGVVYLSDEPQPHLALADSCSGFGGLVRSLMIDPADRRIYACTSDGTLWSWTPGLAPARVVVLNDRALGRRTAFHPDASTLAVSGHVGGATVWDLEAARPRYEIKPGRGLVSALAFSRDGETLAVADNAGVQLLAAESGRPLEGMRLELPEVNCVAFAPDGRSLAIGDLDGEIRIWSPLKGAPGPAIRAHPTLVTALTFTDDGCVLASASNLDRVARTWQASERRLLAELNSQSYIHSIAFVPGSRSLATADFQGRVRFWDASSGRKRQAISGPGGGPINRLAFSSDGETLVCSDTGALWLFEVDKTMNPAAR